MKVQAKIITEQECKWYGVALQDEEHGMGKSV